MIILAGNLFTGTSWFAVSKNSPRSANHNVWSLKGKKTAVHWSIVWQIHWMAQVQIFMKSRMRSTLTTLRARSKMVTIASHLRFSFQTLLVNMKTKKFSYLIKSWVWQLDWWIIYIERRYLLLNWKSNVLY
jgi:hypothetical protein